MEQEAAHACDFHVRRMGLDPGRPRPLARWRVLCMECPAEILGLETMTLAGVLNHLANHSHSLRTAVE